MEIKLFTYLRYTEHFAYQQNQVAFLRRLPPLLLRMVAKSCPCENSHNSRFRRISRYGKSSPALLPRFSNMWRPLLLLPGLGSLRASWFGSQRAILPQCSFGIKLLRMGLSIIIEDRIPCNDHHVGDHTLLERVDPWNYLKRGWILFETAGYRISVSQLPDTH